VNLAPEEHISNYKSGLSTCHRYEVR
jgi:hypothetical protein